MEVGAPIKISDLAKGDFFFIRGPTNIDVALVMLVSADPLIVQHVGVRVGLTMTYEQSSGLKAYRLEPSDYFDDRLAFIRNAFFPPDRGSLLEENRNAAIGQIYYFNEYGKKIYILGRLIKVRSGNYLEVEDPNGKRREYYSGTTQIYRYRPTAPNLLGKYAGPIISMHGPEHGVEIIHRGVGNAAVQRRKHLLTHFPGTRMRSKSRSKTRSKSRSRSN
jgi:hypothetical protein